MNIQLTPGKPSSMQAGKSRVAQYPKRTSRLGPIGRQNYEGRVCSLMHATLTTRPGKSHWKSRTTSRTLSALVSSSAAATSLALVNSPGLGNASTRATAFLCTLSTASS